MHCACESGNTELVYFIFSLKDEHGSPIFDAKAVTEEHRNILHYAFKAGNISLVKYLMSRKDHPNVTDATNDGMTILHYAVLSRKANLVRYIITLEDKDSLINLKNNKNDTALDIAQEIGDHEIMEILKNT